MDESFFKDTDYVSSSFNAQFSHFIYARVKWGIERFRKKI